MTNIQIIYIILVAIIIGLIYYFRNHIALNLWNKEKHETFLKNQSIILDFTKKNGSITNDQVESLTGLADSTARRHLSLLVQSNKLVSTGKGSGVRYVLVK